MNRIVVVDIETTGLSVRDSRVVELCAIAAQPCTGEILSEFHQLVNPTVPIPLETTAVHGIRDDDVRHQPTFANIAPQFAEFVRDSKMVVHNALYDPVILDAEFARAVMPELRTLNVEVIDSLAIARTLVPLATGHTLDHLCDLASVDRSGRGTHGALIDTRLLVGVLPYLAKLYEELIRERSEQCESDAAASELVTELHRIVAPVSAFSVTDNASLAYALAAAVTILRWIDSPIQMLTDQIRLNLPTEGWQCPHFFAKTTQAVIYSYKSAAEAILSGVDLRDFRIESFFYRVSPELDSDILTQLRPLTEGFPVVIEHGSRHVMTAILLALKNVKRRLELQRESLRGQYLAAQAAGYETSAISVTKSQRNRTDYREALRRLAGSADLTAFSAIHTRLMAGDRDTRKCEVLFSES